jgi:hypothetical protein
VIASQQVMVMLADACPSYRALHPGRPDPLVALDPDRVVGGEQYDELGELAHHLVDLAAAGDASELPAVFAVVEQLLTEGDSETVSLIRTGLIEDLQNITSHRDVSVSPDAFVAVLGPTAAEVWADLDEAWVAAGADASMRGRREPAEDYLDLGVTDRRRIQSMTRELPDGTLARPSDVLRYEARQYDEAVGEFRHFLRSSILWFLLAALIALAIIWAFA